MAPFYGWASTASRLETLRGGSLPFTFKFPEIPGTHFTVKSIYNDHLGDEISVVVIDGWSL